MSGNHYYILNAHEMLVLRTAILAYADQFVNDGSAPPENVSAALKLLMLKQPNVSAAGYVDLLSIDKLQQAVYSTEGATHGATGYT